MTYVLSLEEERESYLHYQFSLRLTGSLSVTVDRSFKTSSKAEKL